jgi:predicted membrane protein
MREKWAQFKKSRASPVFYRVVVILLVYSLAAAAFNIYFQYIYDFNRVKLERLKGRRGQQLSSLNRVTTEAANARSWLKLLGAAHLEWPFAPQINYIEFGVLALAFTIIGPFYMRFHQLDYFSWLRWLLNETQECKLYAERVLNELNRLESSMIMSMQVEFNEANETLDRVHRRAQLSRNPNDRTRLAHPGEFSISGGRVCHADCPALATVKRLESDSNLNFISTQYKLVRLQLVELTSSGRLNPLNRSRAWLNMLAHFMCVSFAMQHLYCTSFLLVIYYYITKSFASVGKYVEFTSFRDILEATSMAYLFLLVYISMIIINCFSMITAYDQARAARKLTDFVRATIRRNELRFRKLARCEYTGDLGQKSADFGNQETDTVIKSIKKLELDFLTIIMQYRLFTIEFELAMRPVRFYSLVYLYAALSMSLLVRSHGPYFHPKFKPFSVAMGYASLIPPLAYLLPICYTNQQCLLAYKTLHSLVAQSSYYESSFRHNHWCFSLKFALSLIRRELANPEEALRRFTCRVLFLKVTYPTLLKITFWTLLIVTPMLAMDKKTEGFLDRTLTDPFGIFGGRMYD